MTKADFEGIYTAADPRPYYRSLAGYDYQIPAHSGAVFGQLAKRFVDHPSPRLVDMCCSYGVNATVLKHDLEFDEIVAHYRDPSIDRLDRDELVALDREWYSVNQRPDAPRVCGIDSSEAAISYALDSGLIDAGHAEDLEVRDPSSTLSAELRDADLVTVSGGIGYISERTIDRVLANTRTPRLAVLCLRWIDFGPIIDAGAVHGLVTERLDEATFPQRRFASDDEQRHVHTELDRLGIDADGRETDGYHHADLYVLRPEDEVLAQPLDTVLRPAGAIGTRGITLSSNERADVSVFTSSNTLP